LTVKDEVNEPSGVANILIVRLFCEIISP
jgi:hypothetical protein